MSIITTNEINDDIVIKKPGAQLAEARIEKGYSPEYVASKLHLRVRVIELLELDDYHNMPEPVFIKGYLRAYAKLLDIAPEPLLSIFNSIYSIERKQEKALWQGRRETHHGEHIVRWMTGIFAVGVMVAVAVWWHKNKDTQHIFPKIIQAESSANKSETEIRLTDLSKMRSLLSSNIQTPAEEKATTEPEPIKQQEIVSENQDG